MDWTTGMLGSVVTPAIIFARADMRSELMPRRMASALSSAAEAPLMTSSLRPSQKGMTS